MPPSDAELATQTLAEESQYRFSSFDASEALTLGLSIRKRFRSSSRHAKGKGLVISIQTIAGHTLFSCTVGDLGHPAGVGDVSLDSWSCLEGMITVVKRTGHSSFYVEKGMSAMGKTPKQMGIESDLRVNGGAFPIWLENAPCCPIAIAAAYSGSSQDDHNLVATTIRDYLAKLRRNSQLEPYPPTLPEKPMSRVTRTMDHEQSTVHPQSEWAGDRSELDPSRRVESPYDHREDDESQIHRQ
ncbi:hypothetical protein CC1G_00143 [Coprinopsis cinerea okayama7|uniref:Uncharacterized protein n=1 Tax=Coprinopsis cinerea (strain Okayama-7 / 130 / ATCC MYA-4618 / FGSC 9003) TaxID=240176 RepID=A8NWX2_COPC7|nr:hypothetical protein CC1G_00143 [Coprinopsis cinerea okayama7\|eukprot:XP_001837007.2 hypothetical protein CC1G_00143 [Coprinopsis cinerea okayama7\